MQRHLHCSGKMSLSQFSEICMTWTALVLLPLHRFSAVLWHRGLFKQHIFLSIFHFLSLSLSLCFSSSAVWDKRQPERRPPYVYLSVSSTFFEGNIFGKPTHLAPYGRTSLKDINNSSFRWTHNPASIRGLGTNEEAKIDLPCSSCERQRVIITYTFQDEQKRQWHALIT